MALVIEQGNEFHGASSSSAGLFHRRSSDDAVDKGGRSILEKVIDVDLAKEQAQLGSDKPVNAMPPDSIFASGTAPLYSPWSTGHDQYCI